MADKDIIGKETMRRLAVDLATHLLELPIDPDSLEVLPTEHQRIEDRRADLVARLRDRDGEPFLLHVEIQNNNDATMPVRMMRYMSDILLAWPGLPLRQYLIYIGAESLTMPDGIDLPGVRYRYGLLDMRDVDCRRLLERDTPDALVLAILCNFGDRDPQVVVNHIYARLTALLGDDPRRFREYVEMVHILSGNRDLEKQIAEAHEMLTQIDVERLPAYRQVMEKGLKQGMERGMERGVELGREKGEIALLVRQLGYKFGTLSPELHRRVEDSSPEELALWERRILRATTLEEVFGNDLSTGVLGQDDGS
uniref:Predicted transposase YdaD n=1 Tax=Candidatus Kentrum sp. LFY TaxID=2126342 RepID=A0A450WTF9_9GAMM|nr:MAG: Predicted transposase YdaD [Candidatus Kentron sp. LFY]